MVNFFDHHLLKCQKYGLDVPILNDSGMTKEELKQREDTLTDYFLYELNKPAKSE